MRCYPLFSSIYLVIHYFAIFSLRTHFKAENVREILSLFVNVTLRIKDNRPIGNLKTDLGENITCIKGCRYIIGMAVLYHLQRQHRILQYLMLWSKFHEYK